MVRGISHFSPPNSFETCLLPPILTIPCKSIGGINQQPNHSLSGNNCRTELWRNIFRLLDLWQGLECDSRSEVSSIQPNLVIILLVFNRDRYGLGFGFSFRNSHSPVLENRNGNGILEYRNGMLDNDGLGYSLCCSLFVIVIAIAIDIIAKVKVKAGCGCGFGFGFGYGIGSDEAKFQSPLKVALFGECKWVHTSSPRGRAQSTWQS